MPELGDYSGLLERLRKNRAALPLSVLKTQYKIQYEALVQDLKKAADVWASQFFFCMRPPERRRDSSRPDPDQEIYRKAFIKVLMDLSYSRRYLAALVDDLDEWKFQEICLEWVQAAWAVYPPYFQSRCRLTEDGRVFNDIVNLYWDERSKIWRSKDGTADQRPFPLPAPPKSPKAYYEQGSLLDGG